MSEPGMEDPERFEALDPVDDATETPELEDSREPGSTDVTEHDPTGLDLARQVAASIGAGPAPKKRRRRRSSPRKRPGSKPYDDGRDPLALGDVFGRVVHERGWTTQVSIHAMLANWPRLVGVSIADHSRPERFEDGVLHVRAESTAWATQMRLMAPNLVARLNDELGQGSVVSVQVKGPDAPSWKHGPRSVPGRGPRDTYG